VRIDVDRGRLVQLDRPGAVARLPHGEELGEAASVACAERRADGVERVGERAGDLVLVQVGGARLDVAAVRLEPLMVLRRDPEAEDVHGLLLAAEPGGQLRDERPRQVGDLERSVDGVVVGDGDEVHPARECEPVDLRGRSGALGQAEGALDAELGRPRGGGVAMQVDAADRAGRHRAPVT